MPVSVFHIRFGSEVTRRAIAPCTKLRTCCTILPILPRRKITSRRKYNDKLEGIFGVTNLTKKNFNRTLFPFKYVPFTAIPPARLRPEMPDILRQWIYGFYTREDDDAFLFLRIHLVMLLINIGICAVFIAAFYEPRILHAVTPGKVVSVFLLQYPARIGPCLLLAAGLLTLLTFAAQSSSLSFPHLRPSAASTESESGVVYDTITIPQYLGILGFTLLAVCRLDVFPRYFAGYKLYAGVVDLAHEPWRTMIIFMLVYVFVFQLFIVNGFSFSVIALASYSASHL